MRVHTCSKVKEVSAGYFILYMRKAEDLQCSPSCLVKTDDIEELWKDENTKEKFNNICKRLKEEICDYEHTRLMIDWKRDAKFEAVSNRFTSAKATKELLSIGEDSDYEIDDVKLFEDINTRIHVQQSQRSACGLFHYLPQKTEELQCSASSLVCTEESRSCGRMRPQKKVQWHGQATETDVRAKGSARLVVEMHNRCRYKAVPTDLEVPRPQKSG
eukprot:gene1282-1414_t